MKINFSTNFTAMSLEGIAKHFEALADRQASNAKRCSTKRRAVEANAASCTWRAAAEILRATTIEKGKPKVPSRHKDCDNAPYGTHTCHDGTEYPVNAAGFCDRCGENVEKVV